MKQLLEHIVKALVDEPEKVEVHELEGESFIIHELRVAPDEMGKVIGKQGRIARAIRTVVNAARTGDKRRVVVEIVQ